MDYRIKLDQQKYLFLNQVLDSKKCNDLVSCFEEAIVAGATHKDSQCAKSEALYGYPPFEELLRDMCPFFKNISGKKLIPTYSYARKYLNGETLEVHVDRPSCEISATITLGFAGKLWPFFVGTEDKSDANQIIMNVGDAVIYRGQDLYHWRNEFEGEWQVQVFLHYVDADGNNTEWAFDKRDNLNIVDEYEENFCSYDDILNSKACDIIINTYTSSLVTRLDPFIGNKNEVNTQIRNVERVALPTYKDIGGRLAAAGLSANYHRWNFDISNASQAEFLIYPTGGRYTTHVDTFLKPGVPCRKLTVLAFLNNDFKGGKFYLVLGHEKFYPPQEPGTIIVFPSFIPHGVEDIESGTRYAVVCWMSGPWFK